MFELDFDVKLSLLRLLLFLSDLKSTILSLQTKEYLILPKPAEFEVAIGNKPDILLRCTALHNASGKGHVEVVK